MLNCVGDYGRLSQPRCPLGAL